MTVLTSTKRKELWDKTAENMKKQRSATTDAKQQAKAEAQAVAEAEGEPAEAPQKKPKLSPTPLPPEPPAEPAAAEAEKPTLEQAAKALVAASETKQVLMVVDYEDDENKLQYGLLCYQVSSDEATGMSTVKPQTGAPTPLQVKTSLLREVSTLSPPTKISNLENRTKLFKQQMLSEGDHADPVMSPEIERITKVKPEQLSFEHVMLGMSQVLEAWKSKGVSVHALWPEPLSSYLRNDEQAPDLRGRYGKYLSSVLHRFKLVLAPIHADNHFTLLSIDVDKQEVRYYDTLTEYKLKCSERAQQVCKLWGVTMPDMPSGKANRSKQPGATCASQIIHYTEVELRRHTNEQLSTGGWPGLPRVYQIRDRLSKWCAGLQLELRKWQKEVAAERATQAQRAVKFKAEVEKWQAAGKLCEEAKADAEAFALQLYDKNAAVVSKLEPPDDWYKALERLEAVRCAQRLKLLELRKAEAAAAVEPAATALDSISPKKPKPSEAEVSEPVGEAPQESKAVGDEAAKDKPDWRLELLPFERKLVVERVMSQGLGVCSRCRFTHGCLSCCGEKALRYHLGKAGYVGPAIWEC